ncbi:DUF1642 domain-containing protein [Lactococcus lactis subsp. lactis]|uniref:DUF1642 domain-containing protein n=1 Tax=Lactococcus lactis TaxID=1358 RepID=UPI00300E3963
MTKFEEEFKALTSWDWVNVDLIQQILTRFGNWHSDEEFQELLDKYSNLNDHYEKEVIRSSKLESQLISREKQVIEMREADKAQGKEIIQLKSQLQQQALPVVPEFVAEWIKRLKTNDLKPLKNPETYGETRFTEEKLQNIVFWISENQEDYMRAWLDGYTVEKPQLFYLRDELTGQFLAKDNQFKDRDRYFFWTGEDPLTHSIGTAWKLSFTQQEIDSMETGSYEQIEVAE